MPRGFKDARCTRQVRFAMVRVIVLTKHYGMRIEVFLSQSTYNLNRPRQA